MNLYPYTIQPLGTGADASPYLSSSPSGKDVVAWIMGPLKPGYAAGRGTMAAPGVVPLPAVTLAPAIAAATQPVFGLNVVGGLAQPFGQAVQVVVKASSAWDASGAGRAALLSAFKLFRAQLEAIELDPGGGLIRGAADLIANRLAAALPLRFDEILSYYYGFDPVAQAIDLSPGMVLRVDWAGFQYADAPGGAGVGLNAFANTGSSRLDVVRRPDGSLGFDAFSAAFTPGFGLQSAPGGPVLAAGPLDLQLTGNARRHWRLVWPSNFPAASLTQNAGVTGVHSCRLIGADRFADLEAATVAIAALQEPDQAPTQAATPLVSIAFSGRVGIVPEIWIWVRETAQLVPVGTTMRNLAHRFGDPTPIQMQRAQQPDYLGLYLQRWAQANEQPVSGDAAAYRRLNIDFTSAAAASGLAGDGFDLPLVKGDAFNLSLAKSAPDLPSTQ